MKSLRLRVVALTALLPLASATMVYGQGPNKCLAGKSGCASKKAQGLLSCHSTAEKKGVTLDPACTAKVTDKFDGGATPSKGCFAKLELKNAGPCLSNGDTAPIETKVDAFVDDIVTDLDPGFPAAVKNVCSAGKKKCVAKKLAAILKCHAKAVSSGAPLDLTCVQKAKDKFDGGTNPAKGCFAKLEAKPPCLTSGDTGTIETKVDDFVDDLLCELGYQTVSCAPTPTPTPTRTATPTLTRTPTPTPTSTAVLPGCGNGVLDAGEDCDLSAGVTCASGPFDTDTGFTCSASCQCACPTTMEFTGTSTGGVLDAGWTGLGHDSPVVTNGTVTVSVTGCAGASRPCGTCTFSGPIANAGAANYGTVTGTQMNNHRCTGNTRKTCGPGGEDPTCASSGGTCEFYFGTLVPLAAGGISVCVENRFNGALTGTANIEAGTNAGSAAVIGRVFTGATVPRPCPRCLGDATANDGVRGGTCDVGTDAGLVCDVNGASPKELFGSTSLDCRPSTTLISSLTLNVNNTTGTVTKAVTAANPNCRAAGFTAFKCMCDTCDNLAATPCSSNADCVAVGATTCGGRRCQSGTNGGAPCATASQCPGGSCLIPGLATAINQCDGGVADCAAGGAPGPNDGVCQSGPTDIFCEPNGTMVSCTSDTDCSGAGLKSCVGGTNAGHVCSAASGCPGGSCDFEKCTGLKPRECYLNGGVVAKCGGGTNAGAACVADSQCPGATCGNDHATGAPDVPAGDAWDPTLAALFCLGPTSTPSVNSALGLPGLGRLELQVHARNRP